MMLAMAQCVDCVECRQSAANHHDAGAAVDIFGPVAKPRHPDERWCISDLLAKWPYGRRIAGGENDRDAPVVLPSSSSISQPSPEALMFTAEALMCGSEASAGRALISLAM